VKSVLALIVFVTSLAGGHSALADQMTPFDIADYRKECGGTVFARCGGWFKGANQATMFEHAKAWAMQEKKLILAFSGYDWCPPCRLDVLKFTDPGSGASPELLHEIQSRYVVLPIDRDMHGANSVLKQVGIPTDGFAEVAIFDPTSGRTLQFIRYPQIIEDLYELKKCAVLYSEPPMIRILEKDRSFDVRLQLLKQPQVDLFNYVKDYNQSVEASCK
jgi:hypothetical protein